MTAAQINALDVHQMNAAMIQLVESGPCPGYAWNQSPSRDMSDALYAAERFSLFRQWDIEHGWEGLRFLAHCNQWCVAEWFRGSMTHFKVVASADTAPMAICRAILLIHCKATT